MDPVEELPPDPDQYGPLDHSLIVEQRLFRRNGFSADPIKEFPPPVQYLRLPLKGPKSPLEQAEDRALSMVRYDISEGPSTMKTWAVEEFEFSVFQHESTYTQLGMTLDPADGVSDQVVEVLLRSGCFL
ncbi:hypothetical protein N7454_006145 [Penicillium verhagenii]|nr:hypothetical protein N7454_006145 [Penicillium verhagenii]